MNKSAIQSKNCLLCGNEFFRKDRNFARNRFCSKSCGIKSTPSGRLGKKNSLKQINTVRMRRGVLHPLWKGGNSRYYKTGYYSTEYKQWRRAVFERDNFTCQDCGGCKIYLTAHHIKSFAHYPELRFEITNGKTLCEPCHSKTDNYRGRNNKSTKL